MPPKPPGAANDGTAVFPVLVRACIPSSCFGPAREEVPRKSPQPCEVTPPRKLGRAITVLGYIGPQDGSLHGGVGTGASQLSRSPGSEPDV